MSTKTINVPEWHSRVPNLFTKIDRYFHNINIDNFELQLSETKSKFSEKNFDIVLKGAPVNAEGKRFPVQPLSPPLRGRWVLLDDTGDFLKIKGVNEPLVKSHFSMTVYEGNIPEDIKAFWPGLEQEQTEYFDWLEAAYNKILWLMWEHPQVRVNAKLKAEAEAIANWHFPDCTTAFEKAKAIKSPEYQEKLRLVFFANANVDNKGKKGAFVRNCLNPETGMRPDSRFPGRYASFKKGICSFIDETAGQRQDKLPKNTNHYLNVLAKEKRAYSPAVIYDSRGREILPDFKENPAEEKPRASDEDMFCILPFLKPYDCGQYGIRGGYCSSTIMRKAKEGERKAMGGGQDFSSCAVHEDNNNAIPSHFFEVNTNVTGKQRDRPSIDGYQPPDEGEGGQDDESKLQADLDDEEKIQAMMDELKKRLEAKKAKN